MLPQTKAVYHQGILQEAMDRFGIDKGCIQEAGGFESFVYEFQKNDRPYILKVSHNVRRNMNMVLGELNWLNFLADSGVSVSRAIPSERGNMVEKIELDRSYFMAYAFEKAQGSLTEAGKWKDELIQEWGRTCGQMHRLTKSYSIKNKANRRPQWHEDDIYNYEKHIPHEQSKVQNRYEQKLSDVKSLSKSDDSYGLIHGDLHHFNFFEFQHKITVFDFDDCEYHWFAYDIAVILYHAMDIYMKQGINLNTAQHFYNQLMIGYRREHKLEEKRLKQIPLFIQLRHYIFYALFHQTWDINNLNKKQLAVLSKMKQDIENDKVLLNITF